MTLLTEVMQRPLDPGYAAAAAARQAAGSAPRRPTVITVTLLIAVLCGGVFAIAVRELRQPQPGAIAARMALQLEVERRTAAADRLQKSNEQLRAEIAARQQAALDSEGSTDLAQRSRALGVLAGEFGVSGPGLVITLNDAEEVGQSAAADPRAADNSDQGRVIDRDLQIVVNGLWAAGAEAVSVNGERLTALSAIRSAGQAILVDFRPLVPPYVVQAIGGPADLQSGFAADMAGPYLQSLTSNYGIRAQMQARQKLTLPGAGSMALHYAHLAGERSAASSATLSPPPASSSGVSPSSPATGAAGPAPGTGAGSPSEVSQ